MHSECQGSIPAAEIPSVPRASLVRRFAFFRRHRCCNEPRFDTATNVESFASLRGQSRSTPPCLFVVIFVFVVVVGKGITFPLRHRLTSCLHVELEELPYLVFCQKRSAGPVFCQTVCLSGAGVLLAHGLSATATRLVLACAPKHACAIHFASSGYSI